MAKKKLTKDVQIYIVQQLAMFERPKIVQDLVKEIFEIEITLQSLLHYDISNPDLPKKWKDLFEATRAKFIEDTNDIPIAHKSFRLRKLNKLFENQEKRTENVQNPVEMRAILEQAAKESGDAFTNKRVVDIKNVSDLSDDELLAIANSKG